MLVSLMPVLMGRWCLRSIREAHRSPNSIDCRPQGRVLYSMMEKHAPVTVKSSKPLLGQHQHVRCSQYQSLYQCQCLSTSDGSSSALVSSPKARVNNEGCVIGARIRASRICCIVACPFSVPESVQDLDFSVNALRQSVLVG